MGSEREKIKSVPWKNMGGGKEGKGGEGKWGRAERGRRGRGEGINGKKEYLRGRFFFD